MQQTERQNEIAALIDFAGKSNYLNLEKIQDFKECIDQMQSAVRFIAYHEDTLGRLYRWLDREERRLKRDTKEELRKKKK